VSDIEECGFEDIQPWRGAAAKERTSLNNAKGVTWFRIPGKACAGLLWLAGGTRARIKSVYVGPEHRGQGLGTALTTHLTSHARAKGAHSMEVLAYNPRHYVRLGWVPVARRGDVTKLELTNLI